MNPIICIAGPTASGKTALAVSLAQAFNGEVVSCDSMQIYRRMNIGTAKPTMEERQGIVHHMIDVADPEQDFSVSRYCDMASPIVDDIVARGKNAIIAGGTGLYMDSLIRGNPFAPFPSTGVRERLEAEVDEIGMEAMLERLRSIDPDSAARMHLSDRRRVIRALEVYYETGTTITAHNLATQAVPPRYRPVWLGLDFDPRQLLYDRVNLRVDLMVQQGLIAEIRQLLQSGVPEKCTAMQAIGYKEFTDALLGRESLDDAAQRVCLNSRHYAKRQLTWFRRNPEIHWLTRRDTTTSEEIFETARQIICKSDR